MSLEDTLGALLEAKLAPMKEQVGRLSAQLESVRRALPPVLVPVHEAARILGVSVSTVRRRLRDGALPCRRYGKTLRVDLTRLHQPDEAQVIRLAGEVRLR